MPGARRKSAPTFLKYKYIYLLILPGAVYFLIFKYLPMFGIIIAFKNYTAAHN